MERRYPGVSFVHTQLVRDLAISYHQMGPMDARRDPGKARDWFERALEIVCRLVDREPDDAGIQ